MFGYTNCAYDNSDSANIKCNHLESVKSNYFASAIYGNDDNIVHIIINALLELQSGTIKAIRQSEPNLDAILALRANRN